jgi:hypothetical protein
LHFYFNFSFKFSNIQKSRRRFNITARSARISAPNPRDIPQELRVWPSNQKLRPLGIGTDERQIIDDFYLLIPMKLRFTKNVMLSRPLSIIYSDLFCISPTRIYHAFPYLYSRRFTCFPTHFYHLSCLSIYLYSRRFFPLVFHTYIFNVRPNKVKK